MISRRRIVVSCESEWQWYTLVGDAGMTDASERERRRESGRMADNQVDGLCFRKIGKR